MPHHGKRNGMANFAAVQTCSLADSLVFISRGRRLRHNELLHNVAGWVNTRNASTSFTATYIFEQF
jgi:hypothetical protein